MKDIFFCFVFSLHLANSKFKLMAKSANQMQKNKSDISQLLSIYVARTNIDEKKNISCQVIWHLAWHYMAVALLWIFNLKLWNILCCIPQFMLISLLLLLFPLYHNFALMDRFSLKPQKMSVFRSDYFIKWKRIIFEYNKMWNQRIINF